MKRRKRESFVCEEIVLNILNRLPLESLARFKCVSKSWQKYVAEISRSRLRLPEPYLIGFFFLEKRLQSRFFFSSKESPMLLGTGLDKSVDFIGERVYVVASSSGFLLCNKLRSWQRIYYVYNPATRQRLDLPKTRFLMDDPYVGFTCKVEEDDSVSFTIVRYAIPPTGYFEFPVEYSVTIESFSSETNVWTTNKLFLDEPIQLYPSWDMTSSSSAGVVDGVFCWLDNGRSITVYDSVNKSFWVWDLPGRTSVHPGRVCLGFSGGELYLAVNVSKTIVVWRLCNFPSRYGTIWFRRYDVDVATVVQKCQENFGLRGGNGLDREVQNMVFHPALVHILYLQIRGMVISYDFKKSTVELVYDFGVAWRKTQHYKFFSYEWPRWPRLQ